MSGAIGIIANPAAGRDIRRLVARASTFDNREKTAIVRRVAAGAVAAGVSELVYMADLNRIAESALGEFADEVRVRPVDVLCEDCALDTVRATAWMREDGCAVVVTLGGDGTNRAAALGWRDAPLFPLATGTNSVFPYRVEATVAGTAAGLVATGAVPLAGVAERAKVVDVRIEGGAGDLALIDAVLLAQRFTGARAIWDSAVLRVAVLTRAEATAVGVASVGGLLDPLSAADDAALLLEFGPGGIQVEASIAPGLFQRVPVARARRLALDEEVEVCGPGVLALDGERERVLGPGQLAHLRVRRDGPRVIDANRALGEAARRGLFVRVAAGGTDAE